MTVNINGNPPRMNLFERFFRETFCKWKTYEVLQKFHEKGFPPKELKHEDCVNKYLINLMGWSFQGDGYMRVEKEPTHCQECSKKLIETDYDFHSFEDRGELITLAMVTTVHCPDGHGYRVWVR